MRADPDASRVLRSDDPAVAALLVTGWEITARSWAARLDADRVDTAELRRMRDLAPAVRELTAADTAAALELDRATLADYPGGEATRHEPLSAASASVAPPARRAFGAVAEGRLVAMTWIDVDQHSARAETEFTVVDAAHRGRGLGTAVKAASVLALLAEGVRAFRTGGAAENAASLAANRRLGYVVDEEWLTLSPGRAMRSALDSGDVII